MTGSEISDRTTFGYIRYAQCWEDPEILAEGLKISEQDTVVSIASGGDNSFALLLQEPEQVIALDLSAVQIAVCQLKSAAIQHLDHDSFIQFLGVRDSEDRLTTYQQLRPHLPQSASTYWDTQPEILAAGVIHAGKFEKYFKLFRTWMLPLIHSQKRVHDLLEKKDSEDRIQYFNQVWSNRRWRALFKVFFSEFMLGRLGRDPEFFHYMTEDGVAKKLIERTRYAMTELSTHNNWFMEFILLGTYRNLQRAHPYLRPENFQRLKELLPRIRWELASLEQFLETQHDQLNLKMNLSDIFEYMSADAYHDILRLIHKHSLPGSRIAYWNLFVPRTLPPELSDQFQTQNSLSRELWKQDKAFFYSNFLVEKVI